MKELIKRRGKKQANFICNTQLDEMRRDIAKLCGNFKEGPGKEHWGLVGKKQWPHGRDGTGEEMRQVNRMNIGMKEEDSHV